MLAGLVRAQTFTVLHSFTAGGLDSAGGITNSDGTLPQAGLVVSGRTLYGATESGGANGNGTLFAVNTDGTGFTNLYTFTETSTNSAGGGSTNIDGASVVAGLFLSGSTLYGTAEYGGRWGNGTVFALNTDGTGFKTLHSFAAARYDSFGNYVNGEGAYPQAGLILSGNTLYGTANEGGSRGVGTVFAVNTDGTGFTALHSFTNGVDGANPVANLIVSGQTLYGTAANGGSSGAGTVFSINTDGTGFTPLYSFSGGNDGANPSAGLVTSGNTLYGTTHFGGGAGNGTVFAIKTDGTGFSALHSFTVPEPDSYGVLTNIDGVYTVAGLLLAGGTLYGTTESGGSLGYGTVFAVSTNGSGITALHDFTGGDDGALLQAPLVLSGNTLYGTAYSAGKPGNGTVFSISVPGLVSASPQLTIIPAASNVLLAWPADATGFTLQSTTNLAPPAVWTAVSPGPVVVNGQNVVTNAISGTPQFFRLSQ
jgi:uncharacterized repeat protein (TIGR03803 family)